LYLLDDLKTGHYGSISSAHFHAVKTILAGAVRTKGGGQLVPFHPVYSSERIILFRHMFCLCDLKDSKPTSDKSQENWVLDLNQNQLIFNQKNQFRSPIDPTFPFARSVVMRKIARYAYQAIFVDGIGLNLQSPPRGQRPFTELPSPEKIKIHQPKNG
jgi:hypothetical protein